jgi:hypothetical protein
MSAKTIKKICENYENLEKSLVNQLLLETPNHQATIGTYREAVWKSLFEKIIPKKFCIDQGVFIIDSNGKISAEVDLAIFDVQYTPYIFNYGKIKFIPIEAVAVVIQCKSRGLGAKKLIEWVDSINQLTTSLDSVARVMKGLVDNNLEVADTILKANEIANEKADGKNNVRVNVDVKKSQTSTRPIRILCSIKKEAIPSTITDKFDITLSIEEDGNSFKKTIPKENSTYHDWYIDLNHYDLSRFGDKEEIYRRIQNIGTKIEKPLSGLNIKCASGKENVMLSLIFQLNQMLMLINNPILFPHEAYAKMFGEIAYGK